MAKLIITRKNEFINSLKDYSIFFNGEEIGSISSGETKEFIVPEGTNILKAKNDWYGSKELEINVSNDEARSVSISGLLPARIMIFFISFIIATPLLFREFIRNHVILRYTFIALSIAVLFAIIYYLTIGRNNYLEIKEILAKKEQSGK